MTALKLFLFDLDGTLVSTGGAGLRALSKAFKEIYGINDAHLRINPAGKTDPAIFREVITVFLGRETTTLEIETISDCYLGHLKEEMRGANPKILEGVFGFLEKVSAIKDIVIGLGTGNLEKGARLKLEPAGLNRFFPFGGFGSDHEERSEVLRWGHRRAQDRTRQEIAPASVFVIGDTPLDVAAAKQAGFCSVAVATGRSGRAELAAGQPDFLLSTLTDGDQIL